MKKKKILFITWALDVGGAERLIVKLAQNIPQDNYIVKVVCVTRKGVWAEELEEKGIEVVSMNKKIGFDPGVLFRLRSYLLEEKPDIVNTSIWTADLWGRAAAILAGVKHIIVTEQNVDIWKRWYHKIIDRFLFRWTEYVICVSDEVQKFYHQEFGLPFIKLKMIPNAIDLELFNLKNRYSGLRKSLNIDEDSFLFVCSARLHPQKAHQILIEATRRLFTQTHENFYVLLVGDGERRDELIELTESSGLSGRILFLGLRQDIPNILLQSDCFVLSSDYEGLSLAILEGMAACLPIVATRVGGNSQLVDNGRNGYLVPPRRPDILSNVMFQVMENKESARMMGQKGRAMVEEIYDIKIIAAKTMELYARCL